MIVSNSLRETAVVIKRDGHQVVLVKMGPGRLVTQRLAESQFRATWAESNAPLQECVQRFLDHGRSFGASQEALRGLERLQQRDQCVIASLF